MLAPCAFLPFLPLIDDAMIRQLGDDDFARREAATRFLDNLHPALQILDQTTMSKRYRRAVC